MEPQHLASLYGGSLQPLSELLSSDDMTDDVRENVPESGSGEFVKRFSALEWQPSEVTRKFADESSAHAHTET